MCSSGPCFLGTIILSDVFNDDYCCSLIVSEWLSAVWDRSARGHHLGEVTTVAPSPRIFIIFLLNDIEGIKSNGMDTGDELF